jgi:hypothetical protein
MHLLLALRRRKSMLVYLWRTLVECIWLGDGSDAWTIPAGHLLWKELCQYPLPFEWLCFLLLNQTKVYMPCTCPRVPAVV